MNWLTHKRYNMIDAVGIALFAANAHLGHYGHAFVTLLAFFVLSTALEQVAKK